MAASSDQSKSSTFAASGIPDLFDVERSRIVQVLPAVAVEQSYSYILPEDYDVVAGTCVTVPLGNRLVLGMIVCSGSSVDLSDQTASHANLDRQKLKAVSQVHLGIPPLSPEMQSLVNRVAEYTLTPRGMVLRMVLPIMEGLIPPSPRLALKLRDKMPEKMTKSRQRVMDVLDGGLAYERASLCEIADVGPSVVKSLIDTGVLEQIELPAKPAVDPPDVEFSRPQLTEEQALAVTNIHKFIDNISDMNDGATSLKVPHTLLLEGVTGSGKTEVYFEALAKLVENGQQVVILMPEIALTNTFLDRFEARFGAKPGVWHSNMSKGQRARMWHGIATGQVPVVIGARSSLFLPFKSIGLIIVDEEHEGAYKQEDRVIYNARDMAVMRGYIEKVPVILASATPSIETYNNVLLKRYAHVRLSKRYSADAQLPVINKIDMREEGPESGHWISPVLLKELESNLAAGQQSLLFLNRRGYAPLTLCNQCGHRFVCHQCASWLVEHRYQGKLACHHCGYQQQKPRSCPECQSHDSFVACGPGVERIAQDIEQHFPSARTVLLSSDMEGGLDAFKEALQNIYDHQVDIIIGTQLVAKGYHFPHLTLVGILDVDVALSLADPRAAERSFQLLSQVAGRAGRASSDGRAFIQTYTPDHPVIAALCSYDQDAFYQRELHTRQQGNLPPFSRLASLIISAKDKTLAQSFARALAQAAPSYEQAAPSHEKVRVLGPTEAPLALVRGRYRFRLLVQSGKAFDLSGYIATWLANGPKPKQSLRIQVDMDPISFF